ncbi:hypothetical protein [Paraburkholderia sp.]|uniref:hypothetical protein n=1 Tax=Paraburkholderia sp. TaxID=1926495 RepID=UPI003C7CA2CC
MKLRLQALTAAVLIGSATSALSQQSNNAAQPVEQWRAKAATSQCITYDANDWQYYPQNFQNPDLHTQSQPNGTNRVRPKC